MRASVNWKSSCLHAHNGDVTALGRLSAMYSSVGERSQRMWPPASIRSAGYIRTEGSASLGRIPPTDGGLVPSQTYKAQTYKDLAACADNTAVLTEIRSDPERISNHCRVVTKRGR